MTIAVLLTIGLSLVLILYAVIRANSWRKTPRELRGDWWGRFERQFRAYASTMGTLDEASRRHHSQG